MHAAHPGHARGKAGTYTPRSGADFDRAPPRPGGAMLTLAQERPGPALASPVQNGLTGQCSQA